METLSGLHGIQEVVGSIPISSTNPFNHLGIAGPGFPRARFACAPQCAPLRNGRYPHPGPPARRPRHSAPGAGTAARVGAAVGLFLPFAVCGHSLAVGGRSGCRWRPSAHRWRKPRLTRATIARRAARPLRPAPVLRPQKGRSPTMGAILPPGERSPRDGPPAPPRGAPQNRPSARERRTPHRRPGCRCRKVGLPLAAIGSPLAEAAVDAGDHRARSGAAAPPLARPGRRSGASPRTELTKLTKLCPGVSFGGFRRFRQFTSRRAASLGGLAGRGGGAPGPRGFLSFISRLSARVRAPVTGLWAPEIRAPPPGGGGGAAHPGRASPRHPSARASHRARTSGAVQRHREQ